VKKALRLPPKKPGASPPRALFWPTSTKRKRRGVIIEVNSETDFVAKNDSFVDFVKNCANAVLEQNPVDVTALLAIKDATGMTIEEQLREKNPHHRREHQDPPLFPL
jgi:elongation factor Ts